MELLLQVVNALVKLLYLDKVEQVGVIDLGKWFPAIFGKVFDLKVLSEGNVLYVNLFGLKVSVALSKADAENQQQTDVAIVTIGDSVIKLPCSKNGIDMDGSGSNLTVQLIKGNRTRVEQSTVTGIASGYDVFGGGATQDTDGVKDLSTGYAGGFAGLNDEGVLADDHMVYADTIRGTSGLVDPFSNTKLKSVWDFNTMSDILGPVDDGNGGKAYNTYRIYRKAAANAGEARTSAQDGNKIFSRKNTADDALHTRLDRWEVKLFDVVNTYDSGAVHSGASGDTGATWVGIKDAVTVAGGSSTKLDAYQSPAKAVLMLDVPVSDNNGGLTPRTGRRPGPMRQGRLQDRGPHPAESVAQRPAGTPRRHHPRGDRHVHECGGRTGQGREARMLQGRLRHRGADQPVHGDHDRQGERLRVERHVAHEAHRPAGRLR